MKHEIKSIISRAYRDQRGAVFVFAAITIFVLLGLGALAIDASYLYSAQRTLQATTDASALAGAEVIGTGGSPITTATSYSAQSGDINARPDLFSGVTATATLECFTSTGVACTTNQTPDTSANGIRVIQHATVSLFFARVLGFASTTISAEATAGAKGSVPIPLNVAFILDTTESMNNASVDPTCSGSAISCALGGVRTLLGELWPCTYSTSGCGTAVNGNIANPLDEAALFVFPPVTNTSQAAVDYSCSGKDPQISPTYSGVSNTASKASKTTTLSLSTSMTAATAFNSGQWAVVTDNTNAVIPSGTIINSVTLPTTAVMSASPTGNGVSEKDTIIVAPLYQIVGFSTDYRTSDTATSLNSASDLAEAVGGVSGCPAIQAPGGLGTFYADSITAAQTALVAEQNARIAAGQPGGTNVIVILSDGSASSSSSEMGALKTADDSQECHLAITAANAATKAGTWVYAVYYDDSSPTCNDTTTITSCSTMQKIASDSTKFYSTDGDSGACPSTNPYSSISTIFQNIATSLTVARLLSNNTT